MTPRLTGIRKTRVSAICALLLTCAAIPASARQDSDAPAKKPATTKTTAHATKRSSKKKKSARVRGQQKIDSERATSIQEALIRAHYLSGTSTGTWNQASEDAMRRYQGDHGWQTKQVPDSRALISLGLGPSKDHLLNPESAMTTVPDAPRAASLSPTSHSAATDSTPASNSSQTDPQ
jgi:hypothetical protein